MILVTQIATQWRQLKEIYRFSTGPRPGRPSGSLLCGLYSPLW